MLKFYRGPQGTLFGRNTTAGIIRFTSARPTEEFEARAGLAAAAHSARSISMAAISGLLAPGVSARASVLVQHRNDWIDNTLTPAQRQCLGGYDENAARLQLLFNPNQTSSTSCSTSIARNLDGTPAIFRANVITPGTNGLNANYDRDSVSYNQGGGNPQDYKRPGALGQRHLRLRRHRS